ncbi:hypothetical protein STIAU_6199 [Stigmatella aurantiaca DW4/3-1]|uniref:Uncharacterized protein n=1 Tax=Stigmatella aurantiaca (strain DW4/3-1) TaxID=378806 RepID=Q09BW0_STIAD|nr:hypothetical protein STIAU_6199 [Stigmatella aurantiaca DW4/3-1]
MVFLASSAMGFLSLAMRAQTPREWPAGVRKGALCSAHSRGTQAAWRLRCRLPATSRGADRLAGGRRPGRHGGHRGRLGGQILQGDPELEGQPPPPDLQHHAPARPARGHLPAQHVGPGHGLGIQGHDDIACAQPRPARGPLFLHARDDHSLARALQPELRGHVPGEVLHGDAHPAPAHLAVGPEVRQHGLGDVDGDREADPLAGHVDGVRDGHHVAPQVQHGPSGVARVDGRVHLHVVEVPVTPVGRHLGAALVADDAHRHGVRQPEGVADDDDPVSHLHARRRGELEGRQRPARADAQQRTVRAGILAHHLGGKLLGIPLGREHRDADLRGPLHHVVAREDVAVRVDDEARADALLRFLLAGSFGAHLPGGDGHHGGHGGPGHLAEGGALGVHLLTLGFEPEPFAPPALGCLGGRRHPQRARYRQQHALRLRPHHGPPPHPTTVPFKLRRTMRARKREAPRAGGCLLLLGNDAIDRLTVLGGDALPRGRRCLLADSFLGVLQGLLQPALHPLHPVLHSIHLRGVGGALPGPVHVVQRRAPVDLPLGQEDAQPHRARCPHQELQNPHAFTPSYLVVHQAARGGQFWDRVVSALTGPGGARNVGRLAA